jgi:hypothetical protein
MFSSSVDSTPGRPLMIALFSLESLLLPFLPMVRFLLLPPLSVCSRRMRGWLAVRASALSFTARYQREVTEATRRKIACWEVATPSAWCGVAALATVRVLPWCRFAIWYLVSAVASFINTLRTLGARATGLHSTAMANGATRSVHRALLGPNCGRPWACDTTLCITISPAFLITTSRQRTPA